MATCSNLPPGCTLDDIDRHFGTADDLTCNAYIFNEATKRARHCRSEQFEVTITCTGENETTGKVCGHTYTIPVQFDGELWRPVRSIRLPRLSLWRQHL